MRRTHLVAGFIVVALAFCAQGAPITIAIEATIDYVSDPAGHLEGKITSGGFITGYYTYESTIGDSDGSPNTGLYWQSDLGCGMFLSAGGFNFDANSLDIDYFVGVENNLSGKDKYLAESFNNLALSNGVEVGEIFLQLDDPSATALDNDILPTVAPDLGAWDDKTLNITGGPRGTEFGIIAIVTSAEVVPEPSVILLIGLGAVFLRRRTA